MTASSGTSATAWYFFTATDRDEALLARTKEAYDGAVPSGNSMARCRSFGSRA
jgi:uncharacterized protein YyaL (SSP411 family)